MATSNLAVTIEPKGTNPNQWLIRVTRSCGSASAAGEVVVKTASPPSVDHAPHANLAASKAYLELVKSQLAAGQAQNAVECAKAGLAELGQDYTAPTTIDDTDMKLLAAEDQVEAGQAANAASAMLRVLETRISMYEKLHASELAQ